MRSNSERLSPEKSPDEENLQIFCKQMLKTRIFRGVYQERRYVDSLNGYRDLVIVNSCEKELKTDLEYIRQKISKFYHDEDLWIGISLPDMIGTPASGVCIWTEIDGLAFGNYWFCVKSVRFREREVVIKLKFLRTVEDQGDSAAVGDNTHGGEINAEAFKELWNSWQHAFIKTTYAFFSETMTRENIWAATKFISILLLSLITASIQAIKYLGWYYLVLMKELRLWLHTCTPIILKIIDLIGKVIGGLFIMLTMVYRDIVTSVRGGPTYEPVTGPPGLRPIMDRPRKIRRL